MTLDKELGAWYDVPQNTWFPTYRAENRIITREDNILVKYIHKVAGFHKCSKEIKQLPEKCHPINCCFLGEQYWCPCKLCLKENRNKREGPPGYIVRDDLEEKEHSVQKWQAAVGAFE